MALCEALRRPVDGRDGVSVPPWTVGWAPEPVGDDIDIKLYMSARFRGLAQLEREKGCCILVCHLTECGIPVQSEPPPSNLSLYRSLQKLGLNNAQQGLPNGVILQGTNVIVRNTEGAPDSLDIDPHMWILGEQGQPRSRALGSPVPRPSPPGKHLSAEIGL